MLKMDILPLPRPAGLSFDTSCPSTPLPPHPSSLFLVLQACLLTRHALLPPPSSSSCRPVLWHDMLFYPLPFPRPAGLSFDTSCPSTKEPHPSLFLVLQTCPLTSHALPPKNPTPAPSSWSCRPVLWQVTPFHQRTSPFPLPGPADLSFDTSRPSTKEPHPSLFLVLQTCPLTRHALPPKNPTPPPFSSFGFPLHSPFLCNYLCLSTKPPPPPLHFHRPDGLPLDDVAFISGCAVHCLHADRHCLTNLPFVCVMF